MALLALLFFALQGEQRGEGLVISGLPLGEFAGEAWKEHSEEEVTLELRTERGKRTVSLSFWPDEVELSEVEPGKRWRARGSSHLMPDGLTQRLELRHADTHLIFLDNAPRGADLVAEWRIERIRAEEVQLSLEDEVKRLEFGTTLFLSEEWCATLLGVSLPGAPSQEYADEITEPKADLFIATCGSNLDSSLLHFFHLRRLNRSEGNRIDDVFD